jgi:hypothetical protein
LGSRVEGENRPQPRHKSEERAVSEPQNLDKPGKELEAKACAAVTALVKGLWSLSHLA